MKIAIDASTLSTQGGPRAYVLGLLDALGRIDKENDYVVFYNDPVHMGRFPWASEIVLPGKSPLWPAILIRPSNIFPWFGSCGPRKPKPMCVRLSASPLATMECISGCIWWASPSCILAVMRRQPRGSVAQ